MAAKTKRNPYISYIKGWAIICVILVHLIDWSNIQLSIQQLWLKEFLYTSVFMFVALAGSVMYVAYYHKTLKQITLRLWQRGVELMLVYFLYNIIKLYIYNFKTEPFFEKFNQGYLIEMWHILTFQAFTVPITIIFTIGLLVIVSPLILGVLKYSRYPKLVLGSGIVLLWVVNFYSSVPQISWMQFWYGEHTVFFSALYWLVPYLLGMLLAMVGFERSRRELLAISSVLTIGYVYYYTVTGQSLVVSEYMYPLKPFYVVASMGCLALLMYFFVLLEQVQYKIIRYGLAALRLLGDATLSVYIYHWIVIDVTIWIVYPHVKIIWLTVPLFVMGYIVQVYFKKYD